MKKLISNIAITLIVSLSLLFVILAVIEITKTPEKFQNIEQK